jgi:hypothetical protein
VVADADAANFWLLAGVGRRDDPPTCRPELLVTALQAEADPKP